MTHSIVSRTLHSMHPVLCNISMALPDIVQPTIGSEVHIQCNVAQCQGGCAEEFCPGDIATAAIDKNGFKPGNKIEDGSTLAATTVFVLDPADAARESFHSGHVSLSAVRFSCILINFVVVACVNCSCIVVM